MGLKDLGGLELKRAQIGEPRQINSLERPVGILCTYCTDPLANGYSCGGKGCRKLFELHKTYTALVQLFCLVFHFVFDLSC